MHENVSSIVDWLARNAPLLVLAGVLGFAWRRWVLRMVLGAAVSVFLVGLLTVAVGLAQL